MAEVRWSSEAADWLERIFTHIARDNPNAAHVVVMDIYERALSVTNARFTELIDDDISLQLPRLGSVAPKPSSRR